MTDRRPSPEDLDTYWKERWEREHLKFGQMRRTLIFAVGALISWIFLPFEVASRTVGPLSVEHWLIVMLMPVGLVLLVRDMRRAPGDTETKVVLAMALALAVLAIGARLVILLPMPS